MMASGSWISLKELAATPSDINFCKIGRRNAAWKEKTCVKYVQKAKLQQNYRLTVLPDPVWAQAMRSLPAHMIGMPYFCTGVGLL